MREKKNKKKRKLKIKLAGIILILLILGFVFYFFFFMMKNSIRNIYISGNNYLTDQEIIELAHLEEYPNFFKVTASGIKKNVLTNIYIKEVNVYKKIGRRIYIEVKEHRILFRRVDNSKYVFDNGKEYDLDNNIAVASLINYVPNTIYDELINKLSVTDEQVFIKISEIKYIPTEYDQSRFGLYMDDGNLVYVTLSKFDVLDKYNKIVPTLEGKTGILNLDAGNHFEIVE